MFARCTIIARMPPTPALLTTVQACEIIGFNRSTLSRWIKDGTAKPHVRMASGAYQFTPGEVTRLAGLFAERRTAFADA